MELGLDCRRNHGRTTRKLVIIKTLVTWRKWHDDHLQEDTLYEYCMGKYKRDADV